MSEENLQANSPEITETIDSIYNSAKDTFQQEANPPQPEVPQSNVTIPDPVTDTENFQQYVGQSTTALSQQLSDVSNQLTAIRTEKIEAEAKQAVSQAVEKVNEVVKGDPDIIEGVLTARYNKDEKFRTIWDNRSNNPDALNKALNVVSKEIADKYSIKQDSQLTENQRAINESTKSLGSNAPQNDDLSSKLMKMGDGDFDQAVRMIKRGQMPS